jgi:dienelactone hydrolase
MIKPFRVSLALLLYCLLLTIAGPRIAAGMIVTTVIDLPVKVTDTRGRTVEQTIKITIIRDNARSKSGFLVLNHGRGVNAAINSKRSVRPYFDNARYFVSKGYTVFLPLRVGYGVTGGPDVEFSGGCTARRYPPAYEAGAAQTVATIAYAKTLPYIDPDNGIVVGQSFGGTIAIAMAAKNIPGVRAAINFAGGGGGDPDTHPEQPCRPDLLADLFGSYGTTTRIPTLWLYSMNDRYFGQKYPREWFRAFTERGGKGEFVTLPPYKQDGHPSFTGDPEAWKPSVDAFLTSCCAAHAATPTSALPLRPADAAPDSLAGYCQLKPMPRHKWAAWEERRDLCCLTDADLLWPDAERLGERGGSLRRS